MAVAWNGRLVTLSIPLVVVCGAVLGLGIAQLWRAAEVASTREAPVAAIMNAPAPAPSVAPSAAPQEVTAALATAEAKANDALSGLAAPSSPPAAEESGPAFDVARVENSGEAVIAGRAAPGATVELLRDGVPYDQVVADASGQFVMVPPRLPPGTYDLTLRSKAPNGTIALSKHGVPVALSETITGAVASRADAAMPGRKEASAAPLLQANAAPSSDAVAALSKPETVEPTPPRRSTKIVARGDSLWLISRHAYGDGARYALIYRANRGLIRDPNRIYPGQSFVVPTR